ncbi:MAG TPA: 50S ribosomal protein L9, partial [Phycisphaerales bacterium]|nr:50S ribosomal protein L9 [Phycisphaerales bacterium]
MRILLVTDVERLGWLGDVVEVGPGYARNYLLPQGLGIVPTEANLKALAEEKAIRAEARKTASARLEELAKAAEGAEAVIAAKANEAGLLFGSVGSGQIADNLRQQGFEIAESQVQLPEPIKQVGSHNVTLKFTEASPSEG